MNHPSWTSQEWTAVLVGVIGAVSGAVTSIINALRGSRIEKKTEAVSRKIDEHEENAVARAQARGEQ